MTSTAPFEHFNPELESEGYVVMTKPGKPGPSLAYFQPIHFNPEVCTPGLYLIVQPTEAQAQQLIDKLPPCLAKYRAELEPRLVTIAEAIEIAKDKLLRKHEVRGILINVNDERWWPIYVR